MIKFDREPAIRSMERNVVMRLIQDDFKELCGCQVVMQHSPVEESAANGATEIAIQRVQGQVRSNQTELGEHQGQGQPITNAMAAADRVCCPNATVLDDIW